MVESARPPFSPTIALLTLARTAEVELARVLEPHGLTLRKFGILRNLAHTPGLSIGDLARRSGLAAPDAEALMRALATAGLVSTKAPGGHAPQSTVTPTGSAVLARVASALAEVDARLFDAPERRDLADALAAATTERLGRPQD